MSADEPVRYTDPTYTERSAAPAPTVAVTEQDWSELHEGIANVINSEIKSATRALETEVAELRGQVAALLAIVGGGTAKADVVTLPGRKHA